MSEQVQLLKLDEGSKALGVSTSTVRRWIAAGVIPAVKLGRSVRVRVDDIADVAERGVEYPRRGAART